MRTLLRRPDPPIGLLIILSAQVGFGGVLAIVLLGLYLMP